MITVEARVDAQRSIDTPTSTVRTLFVSLPELVPAAVAAFSVPAMVLLLLGWFIVPVVLAVGLACAAFVVVILARHSDNAIARPRERLWMLATVVLAIGFFLVNAKWSAQNIYATRDPATYTLAGQWLINHSSVLIPTQSEVFGDSPGLTPESLGFYNDPIHSDRVYAQGNHLLPILLAATGWIGGPEVLLRTNALIGALALLAMFGLVRRFAGGGFAFAAAAALAVSLPMLGFSRDTYTEPLTLLLLFGGLAVLWRAIDSGRRVEFVIAGLTLGTAALVRIDAYAALYAVIVTAVALLVRASATRVGRRPALVRAGLLVGTTAAVASLGYLDATRLSSGYYRDERHHILPLLGGTVVLSAIGALVVFLAWKTTWLQRAFTPLSRRTWLALLGSVTVVAFFAVLISRPWWMTDHGGCNPGLGALQAGLRLDVDPCRTYSEYTVHWLAWYFGWPSLIIAVLGLGMLIWQAVRRADIRLLMVVSMVLSLSGLYFIQANVLLADHIWVMRRYLPVVIPGLLGAGAYFMYRLAQLRVRRGESSRVLTVAPRLLAVGLAGLMVLVPAAISHPMYNVRTGVPQLAQLQAVCDRLGEDAAVVSVGRSGIGSYVQSVRSYCGVPSSHAPEASADLLALAQKFAADHGRTLYVMAEKAADVPYAAATREPVPFDVAHVTKWPERLMDVPQSSNAYQVPVYLGKVDATGHVEQILR